MVSDGLITTEVKPEIRCCPGCTHGKCKWDDLTTPDSNITQYKVAGCTCDIGYVGMF